MGSINCKEYVTTPQTGACAKNTRDNIGTSGYYHSKGDKKMDEFTAPVIVCRDEELKDNEMRQFSLDGQVSGLLIRQDGVLSAIGNTCTHYGAPMSKGALGKGVIRCPFHGACFNIATGDIEDFPGLDSLPCYRVNVNASGEIEVSAKQSDVGSKRRVRDMVRRLDTDERTFVVVGGGPAGGICCETLRQEGFTGRIMMLCKEEYPPYDRVKVSKSMDVAIENLRYRDMEFYTEYGIEAMMGVEATAVDAISKVVTCSNGATVPFEKMFVATGASAFTPPIPGVDCGNVHTVRNYADAKAILPKVKADTHVVCLGFSFIALETAAFFAKKVKSVTVVGREEVPLLASFGDAIGRAVLKLFVANGVKLFANCGIERITSNANGNVCELAMKDCSVVRCDLLILGTGTTLNTGFLKESGVQVNGNGSIDTDKHLMTNCAGIYAGGDVANAPVFCNGDARSTIGHYQLAQLHGRVAAINMAGKREQALRAVPFFFTMLFGKGLRYAGHGAYTHVEFDGDVEGWKFAAYYLNEDNVVVAVASCGRDPICSQYAQLRTQGGQLKRDDVFGVPDHSAWTKMLLT